MLNKLVITFYYYYYLILLKIACLKVVHKAFEKLIKIGSKQHKIHR